MTDTNALFDQVVLVTLELQLQLFGLDPRCLLGLVHPRQVRYGIAVVRTDIGERCNCFLICLDIPPCLRFGDS